VGTLEGVVCLVTGAGQGIGRGIATRLAREGGRLAINDVVEDDRMKAVVEATGGVAAPADIADRTAIQRMVQGIEEELGPPEVLVCNAARMTMVPFLDEPPEQWWEQIHVNLTGHMDVIAACLPGMRRLGRGRIVLISSLWGPTGWGNASGYTATKSALISLGRALGRELAPERIYVSIVAPGITDTPQLQVDADDAGVSLDEIRARYAENIPDGRIATPDDIAAAVAFLATETARAYVGQTIHPNGGEIRCSM
jgi:2-hydroxycyclohexanecarboxyl-CoA dehydrogenase